MTSLATVVVFNLTYYFRFFLSFFLREAISQRQKSTEVSCRVLHHKIREQERDMNWKFFSFFYYIHVTYIKFCAVLCHKAKYNVCKRNDMSLFVKPLE